MNSLLHIVILASPAWRGNYMKSTVELAKELTANKDVDKLLFIDSQRTYKDLILKFYKVPFLRMIGLKNRMEIDNNTIIYTPSPILPINWVKNEKLYSFLAKINSTIIKRNILSAYKRADIKNPVVVNAFNPIVGYYLHEKLQEQLSIYYCYDEISACEWSQKHGPRYEEKFAKQVDIIACTSSNLALEKSKFNPNVITIKNGVDYENYHKHFKAKRFSAIKKVVIGYIGSIDDRLDYELLEYCIKRLKTVEFRFVGRIKDAKYKILDNYPNVTFIGNLTPDALAVEVNNFHVGLIPFVKNKFTANVYPLKINEYLSAGLMVVSTDFADLSDFKNDISITSTHEDFLNGIKRQVSHSTSMKSTMRTLIGKTNSWAERAKLFISEIKKCL